MLTKTEALAKQDQGATPRACKTGSSGGWKVHPRLSISARPGSMWRRVWPYNWDVSTELPTDRPCRGAGPAYCSLLLGELPAQGGSQASLPQMPWTRSLRSWPRQAPPASPRILYRPEKSKQAHQELSRSSSPVRYVSRETQLTWLMVLIKYGPESFPCRKGFFDQLQCS